jgi:hypothetical protein
MGRVLGLESVVHAEGQLEAALLRLSCLPYCKHVRFVAHRALELSDLKVDWKSNTYNLALSSSSCCSPKLETFYRSGYRCIPHWWRLSDCVNH